jgi:hypothetical protein
LKAAAAAPLTKEIVGLIAEVYEFDFDFQLVGQRLADL